MRRILTLTTIIFFIFLTACAVATEEHIVITQEVFITREVANVVAVTATPIINTSTRLATVEVTATPSPPPAATPTKTLSPIRATQQALLNLVTVEPNQGALATPIAPDDYVALTEQACRIVRDNYVRDNYNGADWEAICAQYIAAAAAITDQESHYDHLTALIAELDDNHSRFVPPDRFGMEFGLPNLPAGAARPWSGLHIWSAREDEQLLIWCVSPNGSGAAAGLRRGDIILAINGDPVERGPDGFAAAVQERAIFGDEGDSTVTLTVQQGPDAMPEDVTLRLGGASGCNGWRTEVISDSPYIGYIRVPNFGGESDTLIMEGIEALEEERPLDGLILDVRHNGGGNSDRDLAIFTTGEFGLVGPLRADATQTIYRIRGPVRWNETTPAAVLTDGASHSAAEYFATGMQQSGRAVLVGMPTAGNTEGITGFNLADGSLIRLAVMTLQLPDGSTLEEVGVIPDIVVPLQQWGLRPQPDVQLQAAIEALREQIK